MLEILCIIGGFIFVILGVYFIMKHSDIKRWRKEMQEHNKEIISLNNELDEIQSDLKQLDQPIDMVHKFSIKILSFLHR